ncbi:MAG: ferrochelatase [Myxococcales bacterium]|nr:ferrochelatase [Myxococcales bacterium]
MAKKGLLLINLGTPDSTSVPDVRKYLREFLSDPRVLDMNPAGRWALLNFVILRTRPAQSAHAYKTIWFEQGSPLLVYGLALRDSLRERYGTDVQVELAMRYQNPSIASALKAFREQGVDDIAVFPLFPQYSSAATGSAVEKTMLEAAHEWNTPSLQFVPAFYDHPAFIRAFAEVGRPVLSDFGQDYVLMSFHGLPERHCIKSDESQGQTHCLKSTACCDQIVRANRNCYRAQCYATARALAEELELGPDDYGVSFQSRLGRDPWIKPYTDELLLELAAAGKKRIAVYCPAFIADCLETLEEIGIRAKEDFVAAGGEDLILVPSLNDHPAWVDAVAEIVAESYPVIAAADAAVA